MVFGLPPFRLFLEVMGMSVECEVVATFPKVVGKSAGEKSLSWKIEPDMGTWVQWMPNSKSCAR